MSQKKAKQREYGTELKLAAVRRVLAGESVSGGWPIQTTAAPCFAVFEAWVRCSRQLGGSSPAAASHGSLTLPIKVKGGAAGCIVPTLRKPRRVGQPAMVWSIPSESPGDFPIRESGNHRAVRRRSRR